MEIPFATPNQWKKVLFNLYNGKLNIYKDYNAFEEIHPAKDIMMKKENFAKAINFLKEHNLVEIRDDYFYYLTLKGFDIAFELEKQMREIKEKKRFEILQKWIICLTAIIAFSSIVNILF